MSLPGLSAGLHICPDNALKFFYANGVEAVSNTRSAPGRDRCLIVKRPTRIDPAAVYFFAVYRSFSALIAKNLQLRQSPDL